MGALTLKTYPFELRGWDIEKFESIDPTDGFGLSSRVYINKNQIVQIEPNYDSQTLNSWITDKGRQFFDGIFGTWSINKKYESSLTKKNWLNIITNLIKTLYILDHCNVQHNKNHFSTIVFENISIKCLSIRSLIDLTFPTTIIGSNINYIKSICEGNHLACQDFKYAQNPSVIINNEMFKRVDGNKIKNDKRIYTGSSPVKLI